MTSPRFLDRLPLRDALFLGFCAGAIILCKILFRWHLGISGHSMFFTLIGLMVARSLCQLPLERNHDRTAGRADGHVAWPSARAGR